MPTTGNAEAPQAQHVYSTTTAAFYVAELLDQPELGEFERKRAATGGGFGFYDDPHDHAPRLGEFRALPSNSRITLEDGRAGANAPRAFAWAARTVR